MKLLKYRPILIVMLIGIIGRASLLEYTDLLDPTEARYASIAQDMVNTGNWLTPMLPLPEGTVPYLGKPPLHFWLTALSYKMFGVDEWTARLASFVATLVLLFLIYGFTKCYFGMDAAKIAVLMFLSSVLVYFVAGASIIDVTLMLFVTSGAILLYRFVSDSKASSLWAIMAAATTALAFLVKGPVSVVLVGLPLLIFSGASRDFSWLKRFPWLRAGFVFLAIISPWFILSEEANPGFIRYFIWNENVARYLFKDYGDRYGNGHVHPYGTIWLMLVLGFAPWIFLFLSLFSKNSRKKIVSSLRTIPHLKFVLSWMLATPIFFTFVRQLHPMYVLPALPPLAILTAVLFSENALNSSWISLKITSRKLIATLAGLVLLIILISSGYDFEIPSFMAGVFALSVTLVIYKLSKQTKLPLNAVAQSSLMLFCVYLLAFSNVTPYINANQSAESVLETIADSKGCISDATNNRVGVSTKNSFSHYWVAKNWGNELSRELKISYVSPETAATSNVCHYLTKTKSLASLPKSLTNAFDLMGKFGEWTVFLKKSTNQKLPTAISLNTK